LLDSLYGQVMRLRRRSVERHPQRQRRLARPVISVGNLSVGGTGKTPVVAALAVRLIEAGHRPAILSRGYARTDAVDGVVVVSDGTDIRATIDIAGDEPLMLARQVPQAIVCVSPDRHLAGTLAEHQLGCTVHILDDGFQHLDLARNLDVLVTTIGEIPNGRVLPAGRLREPMDAAARAHFLVVSDATAGAAQAEAWALGIQQSCGAARTLAAPVAMGREPFDSVRENANVAQGRPGTGSREPEKILAVAGIANPQRFFDALKAGGWNVVDSMAFPDHHRYTAADIAAIATKLKSSGADVVFTTDKDAVRLDSIRRSAEREGGPIDMYRVPLVVQFDPPDALFQSAMAVLQ
jgi:tetraacyldisaccharide 4'-kinase